MPAIVEAEDDGLYVLKFRGAGQGPKSLIAELVAGEIARTLGLTVPEIVFMELDIALGRNEPDYEIYNLIKASVGRNLALDYLPGALTFDALDTRLIDPLLASSIVWFDAYVSNVDRTPRNTNMLFWHKRLYLIDHGASLYFHHTGVNYLERSHVPFSQIKDHVLLRVATQLPEADALLKSRLNAPLLESIIDAIPDEWLGEDPLFTSKKEHRAAYLAYLLARLAVSQVFVEEALHARTSLV
ncbi:MAG: aminotransferase class I and II [Ktedonobacteraceae bacterium]